MSPTEARAFTRRLRLARWAGAVARDVRVGWTRALFRGVAHVESQLAIDAMRDRDRYRTVVETAVAGLAKSWGQA